MSEVVQGPARPAVRSTEPNIERPAGVERPAVIDVAILLVEPDARVRQTLLEILTRKGCRVVAFRSVHQAEIHVRHAGYDVLIASPEVLRETQHWPRRTPGGAPLGTIAVVGTGAVDRKVEAVQLGASGVLTPPFEAAAVVLEIRSAISRMRDR